MRVAEGHEPITGNHNDNGIGTAHTLMHAAHSLEHGGLIQYRAMCRTLQLMRQHIEQHFRIGVSVDVT